MQVDSMRRMIVVYKIPVPSWWILFITFSLQIVKMETLSTDPTLEKDNIVALLSVAGVASESIE